MKILRYINKIIAGVIIVALFFLTVGVAYSYYLARLSGVETNTTITGKTGSMELEIDGGAQITTTDIAPSKDPFITKTFTVKGTNKTNDEMRYKINLVIDENTFSNGAISYTLTGTNPSANGLTAPDITTRTDLNNGTKSLGIGKYVGQITNGIHSYELKLYFYETDFDQLGDLGKTFNAHIIIQDYNPCATGNCLKDRILAQDGGTVAIEAKGIPNFSKIAVSQETYNSLPETGDINTTSKLDSVVENGLYASEDEYGMSYYYRGDKNHLNNNLIFVGFQWKIIRINGDKSIRIIYNGTEAQFNSNGVVNNIGSNTQRSTLEWNSTNRNDVKYLGYMYGGANGVASTVRNGTTSAAATYNETTPTIKFSLDYWYQTNISGKPFENQIIDNLFCNDRQLESEVGGAATGPGYGSTQTNYAAYHRLYTTKTPTLKCGLQNDRFTVKNKVIGNGSLTYPIGLITADEVAMAGLIESIRNNSNYLFTDQFFWTFSPRYMYSGGYAYMIVVTSLGRTSSEYVSHNAMGVRPVINISPDVIVTGDGSASNPFKVV